MKDNRSLYKLYIIKCSAESRVKPGACLHKLKNIRSAGHTLPNLVAGVDIAELGNSFLFVFIFCGTSIKV